MAEVLVTMQHARAASLSGIGVLCAPSIRRWFSRYGLDLQTFLREGLPASQLEATGDAFALRAVAIARAEQEAA
jgi:hypothetical protein